MNKNLAYRAAEFFLSAPAQRNFELARTQWLELRTRVRTNDSMKDERNNQKIADKISHLQKPVDLISAVAEYLTSSDHRHPLVMAYHASRKAKKYENFGLFDNMDTAYGYKHTILNTLVSKFASTPERLFTDSSTAKQSFLCGQEVLCIRPSSENRLILTLLFFASFSIHPDINERYELVCRNSQQPITLHLPLNQLVPEIKRLVEQKIFED